MEKIKRCWRWVKSPFDPLTISLTVADVMRQLTVASIIGAIVMLYPMKLVPGIDYHVRASILFGCAVVLLFASVLLKGGQK